MNTAEKVNSGEKNWLREMGKNLFQTLFPVAVVTLVMLIILEAIYEDSVRPFIDLNRLIVLVVIIGAVNILNTPDEPGTITVAPYSRPLIRMICFSISGAAIVWYKTQDMGWISYIISVVSGLIIVLLLSMIWQKEEGVGIEEKDIQGS